jgi:hypothetical protein
MLRTVVIKMSCISILLISGTVFGAESARRVIKRHKNRELENVASAYTPLTVEQRRPRSQHRRSLGRYVEAFQVEEPPQKVVSENKLERYLKLLLSCCKRSN